MCDCEHSELRSEAPHTLMPVSTVSINSGSQVIPGVIYTRKTARSVFFSSSNSVTLVVSGAVISTEAISVWSSKVTDMPNPESSSIALTLLVSGIQDSRSILTNKTALRMIVDDGLR